MIITAGRINKERVLIDVAISTASPVLDATEERRVRLIKLIAAIACSISPDNAIGDKTITLI